MKRCERQNGKGWRCRIGVAVRGARWCEKHLAGARGRDQSRYTMSVLGLAARLRYSRRYTREDAAAIAPRLVDPAERCAVCGVPNAVLITVYDRGGPFQRGPSNNCRRLTVDRIDPYGPHELANTRLACWPCNALKGQGVRSDGSVSEETRRWWAIYGPEDLRGWLAEPWVPTSDEPFLWEIL